MTQRSVRQFAIYVDAVLSQNFIQHGENLRQPNKTALYERGNHPNVTNGCVVNFRPAIIIDIFIPV